MKPQAQASKPCPYIATSSEGTSWCRLAAQPQVNQQLLEAGLIIRRLLDEAVDDFYYETDPDGLIEEARAAIAAAQEDALIYGTSVMRDGKHIPLKDFYAVPEAAQE